MSEWTPTRAMTRGIVVAVVVLVAAVLLGRADLVVVAVPFVLGPALALRRRPAAPMAVELGVQAAAPASLTEGDEVAVVLRAPGALRSAPDATPPDTAAPDAAAPDMVLVEVPDPVGVNLDRAGRTVAVAVPARSPAADEPVDVLRLPAVLRRWGRHAIGPVRVRPVTAGGLLLGLPVESERVVVKVHPDPAGFEADDAMPGAAGLVGAHPARRYGDSGELADIRRYVAGDRLRRIDWRTSLRTGEPHVVQTYSERDTELTIVLDVLHDAGAEPSVLDLTVRATAGIVQHYTERGDRVKLVEYGGRARTLRGGAGGRHRALVGEWLLDTTAGERRFGPSALPMGRALAARRALVIVLTPFMDDRSVATLADLARSRRELVVIDTLPPGLDVEATGRHGRWRDVAFRLWRLERQNTIDRLVRHGVPVVRWAGPGCLDQALRGLTRLAATR